MKKILSAVLAASMLISSLASGAFDITAGATGYASELYDISSISARPAQGDSIESKLKNGMTSFAPTVDFVKHKKGATDSDWDAFANEIVDVYLDLLKQKEFFYVVDSVDFDGYIKGGTLSITVKLKYIVNKDKYSEYKSKFDKSVKNMLSGVKKDWTDIQKAAYLHDRLILDTSYLRVDNSRYTSTPYSALVNKKALCTGYARAYSILLSEVGIESRLCVNDDHEWNLVKIGKNWYHVDCTYDDSFVNSVQQPYNVFHDYFLKSDGALADHPNPTPAGVAKATAYDSMKWTSYNGSFAFYGKGIVYMGGDGAYSYDTSSGKIKKLFSVKDTWEIAWREYHTRTSWTDHSRSLEGTHSSLVQHGNDIYYNLAHGIYKYDPQKGKITTVYTNKKSESMLINVFISQNKLYAVFMDKDGNEKTYRIKDLK